MWKLLKEKFRTKEDAVDFADFASVKEPNCIFMVTRVDNYYRIKKKKRK